MEYKELNIFEKLSAYNEQTVSNEHEVFTAMGDCCICGDHFLCVCSESCCCCGVPEEMFWKSEAGRCFNDCCFDNRYGL